MFSSEITIELKETEMFVEIFLLCFQFLPVSGDNDVMLMMLIMMIWTTSFNVNNYNNDDDDDVYYSLSNICNIGNEAKNSLLCGFIEISGQNELMKQI